MQERRERFEAVAREVMEPVRRFLARRTDPDTADDVLADTLLVLWRRLEDVPGDPLPWTYAVARHCLANADRSARRRARVAGKVAALDPPPEAAEDPGGFGDYLDLEVHEALARLRPDEAELLRLWAWEELTPGQIATVLELTPNAVSLRLRRAKDKLREQLRQNSGGPGHEPAEGRQP